MPSEFSGKDSHTVRSITPGNAQRRKEKEKFFKNPFPLLLPTALTDGTGTRGNVGVTVSQRAVVMAYKFLQPGAPPAEIYASISAVTMLPRAFGWRMAGRQWQGVWGTRHDLTAFLRH